ncbi:MAG TPA: hypothetical protein VFR51_19135 [Pyrinomonadaceae bacterium]|nr:hypothetical protein [Pyrinomonadaceae bacterium]
MTKLSIPIKYGLLTTLGVIAWVLVTHSIFAPTSAIHTAGAMIWFNVLQFVMIYLGLKAKEREYGDKQDFKKGVKTGVAISAVYGVSACVFFAIALAIVGTRLLVVEGGPINEPATMVAARAFVGLFATALFLGLIYSTVISFFLAKRSNETEPD